MKTFLEYLNERKLSDTELKYRERYVKKLKPKLKDFQKRYGKEDGKDWAWKKQVKKDDWKRK